MQQLDINAAIDLNPDFNPIAITLMQAARAEVKIGYYSRKRERYYNILIDRKNTDFLERGNRYIIQLLGLNWYKNFYNKILPPQTPPINLTPDFSRDYLC